MRKVRHATRPDWDTTWLAVADVMARRSLCSRSKVGAVIVDKHNRVVATGYNGPPAGFFTPRWQTDDDMCGQLMECKHWCMRGANGPEESTLTSYEDCPSLHAELNALSVCERRIREGGTIYITSDVCYSCAKAIANSGLQRVVIEGLEVEHRNRERTRELLIISKLDVAYVQR